MMILGGGSGCDIDDLNTVLKKTNTEMSVNCTVVDRCIWPLNLFNRGSFSKINTVSILLDEFDTVFNQVQLNEFDVVYFARSINRTDFKTISSGSDYKTYLTNVHNNFADYKGILAFGQIDLENTPNDDYKQDLVDFNNVFEDWVVEDLGKMGKGSKYRTRFLILPKRKYREVKR